jgi:hypothetical protein
MHACITAMALWAMALAVLALGTSHRDPFGQLKWTDFVHFYTIGHVAQQGPVQHLYDAAGLHRDQVALVPASAPEFYIPVYPPQTALVFAPFARLPYLTAGAVWALVTVGIFAFAVWLAWRPARTVLPLSLIVAAAAAFPPLQQLVLNGQTTAIALAAFAGGAYALTCGRKDLAGVALSLLFLKPQFGLVLAVVVIACREWTILKGLVLSAAAQSAIVVGLLGTAAFGEYVKTLPKLSGLRGGLEPRAESMQSITALTNMLPGPAATIAWLLASSAVCYMVVRVWRSYAPVAVRTGALALGSMLVNPHVNLYDAAVIAPALVSLGGWLEGQDERWEPLRRRWRVALYVLYALLLVPTGRLAGLQLSPLVLLWMMHAVWRVASEPRAITAAASALPARLLATDSGPR